VDPQRLCCIARHAIESAQRLSGSKGRQGLGICTAGSHRLIAAMTTSLQISLKTKDVFIECTATDLTKAKIVLNTVSEPEIDAGSKNGSPTMSVNGLITRSAAKARTQVVFISAES
jgi:hypothetical protein